MRVLFSPATEHDLEEIGDYIANDNPRRAITFIREVRERCNAIGELPYAAPLREDILPGLRMIPHGNYLLFYTVIDGAVRIERILHGVREIGRLLKDGL